MAAPVGAVMMPTARGYFGSGFLRDASNSPSAASFRLSASNAANRSPAPSFCIVRTLKVNCPRCTQSVTFPSAVTFWPFSGVKPSEAASLRHIAAETAAPSSLIEK